MVPSSVLGIEIELEILGRAFGRPCQVPQPRKEFLVEIRAIAPVDEAALRLFQRSESIPTEPCELPRIIQPVSFRNVSVSGGTRVADLIAIFEILRSSPGGSKRKHFALECVSKLPRHEIPKVSNRHASDTGTGYASTEIAQALE